MKTAKLLILASATGFLGLSSASAAVTTYTVMGLVQYSNLPSATIGGTVLFSFDYDPDSFGGDGDPSSTRGSYHSGITNMTVLGPGMNGILFPSELAVVSGSSTNRVDIHFVPGFGVDGASGTGGGISFMSSSSVLATDAVPQSLMQPWDSGTFRLDFFATGQGTRIVGGSLIMSTLNAVPEPSAAMLLGAAGGTVLLRRRRSRVS